DKYALLSKLSFPNITIRDIFSIRIGIPRGTAYEEQFKSWFPEHSKVTYYESTDAAFIALEHDELDMIMSSQRSLLAITNYHEYPGYKANLVFDQEAQSYFGFNKNQVILNSIFNKALSLIEIENISEQWALKTYDYKGKIMQAQRPWLIGVAILFFLMLVFVVSVFLKERSIGKANLQKAVAKAEAANNAKSTFLANMSHEIRTPMNAILSITEILAMQENVPAKIEDGLGRIYNSCNLLLGIINDILDFSKIEAGKLDIIPEEYNVASMISDSIQLNMIRIESKPIEFKIDIDENIPAKLIGDELRIKQILNNILSNAFKYTDSGDVILSVTFKEPCLEFRICDTGYGMTKEQLGRLFDEYVRFQGNNKGKTVQGTGLGMPITNRLVGLMGGEISVESEFGKGSQFIVRLPQKTVNDKVIGKGIADNLKRFRMNYIAYGRKSRITRKPMPYGKVLIVDDVEANLYVAVGLMKLYQLQIDTAMNGRSAIDKIKDEKKYDIVFMDHMMPEMDGIEAAKHIRKFGYTSPIIALTANAVVGQAEVFLQNGFDEFIAKPIDIRQLDSILNKFICEKHPEEAALVNHEEIKTETQSFHMLNIDIAGLNVLEGLRRYNDNEAMYLKVLRFYVTNISSMLNSIEAVSEDKLADYQITVHGIKGASLDIFAEYVGKSAKDLEMAAKSKDFSYIKAHNAQFIESTREFISELEGVLLAIDAENPKPKKEKPSAEILLELLNACKAYDINGVDLAMEEIEKYQYTADDGLANWLRENIDIMNFTQIVQKLTKLSN
ncbi:MAG: ATP-binding protein, partial [Fibromonadales bacterium]|nr:ATP-binding protein [Fibromonadales bacterium]